MKILRILTGDPYSISIVKTRGIILLKIQTSSFQKDIKGYHMVVEMNNRELIYQSLDVIEKNLKSNMSVYTVSKELGFSIYYFSRIFKGITGLTPKNYMLGRKITESVNDILNTEKMIIEIAYDYGFGTPESFSRAFQKIMGINPSEIRKSGKADRCRLVQPVTRERIERIKIKPENEPELVELGPIRLIGIPFYYELWEKDDLSNPWQNLIDNISAIPDKIIPEKYYQVQYWFPEQDQGSIFFFIALEVNSFKEIPMQFTAKTLPRIQYLKFQHKGLSNTVGYTYRYIYEEWLPESNYKLPYLFNFEYYGDRYKGPYNEDSISEIYIPVDVCHDLTAL